MARPKQYYKRFNPTLNRRFDGDDLGEQFLQGPVQLVSDIERPDIREEFHVYKVDGAFNPSGDSRLFVAEPSTIASASTAGAQAKSTQEINWWEVTQISARMEVDGTATGNVDAELLPEIVLLEGSSEKRVLLSDKLVLPSTAPGGGSREELAFPANTGRIAGQRIEALNDNMIFARFVLRLVLNGALADREATKVFVWINYRYQLDPDRDYTGVNPT